MNGRGGDREREIDINYVTEMLQKGMEAELEYKTIF